jgi:hypothetical protein
VIPKKEGMAPKTGKKLHSAEDWRFGGHLRGKFDMYLSDKRTTIFRK